MWLGLLLLLGSARGFPAGAGLPAPVGLTVEYLSPGDTGGGDLVVVGTSTPRFSFLPHTTDSHPGRGVSMSGYHLVVRQAGGGGAVVWDSGLVNATAAVGIVCGVPLPTLASYTWAATWSAVGITAPSPTTEASFTVGPVGPADWASGATAASASAANSTSTSAWLGAGQNQFRLTIATSDPEARIFVASPGGAVLHTGAGVLIGTDSVGISAWVDTRKSVPYQGFALPPSGSGNSSAEGSSTSDTRVILLTIGHGFWSGSYKLGNPFWGIPRGTAPVAQVLVMGGTLAKVEGRVGAVVSDDPWEGVVVDCGLSDEDGWSNARQVPVTGGYRPTGVPIALQVPYASTTGNVMDQLPVKALEAVPISRGPGGERRWLYKFSRNIVGHAAVMLDALTTTAAGNLTLRHCENLNTSLGDDQAFCLALAHLPDQPDVYMLPGGLGAARSPSVTLASTVTSTSPTTGQQLLAPLFTWHGFQYVIVEATEGVSFDGKLGSLVPRWTVPDIARTAAISFAGDGAETLAQIQEIVLASQIGNLAGYGPTDCPTREKHWWLGDAQVTAEEAMYNLFTPGVYELFASEMRASQVVNTSNPYHGFIRGVVPADVMGPPNPHHNNSLLPGDISWTAAYPLTVNWMLLYYGNRAAVREHWEPLKAFVDGQRREMGPTDGVPSFFKWGDWCGPVENRSTATAGTGPAAAAANYVLAVEAMVTMATAIGETADAAAFSEELAQWRTAYHHRFWDPSTSAYTPDQDEVQTLTTVSLGAGVVPEAHLDAAVKAVTDDIVGRGYHPTVGSVGQKWLLRELTANGEHDTALKLATQTSYPSWGHWLAKGATTCWENWSGVCDETHPGTPWPGRPGKYISENPPTHNHIFLCGGVGEWMHRSLGGIAPASPGYATVSIAPQISKTEGPSAVNASITTVRGLIKSSWVRKSARGPSAAVVLELKVSVPVGCRAIVAVPLLGVDPSHVRVQEVGGSSVATLWAARDGDADHPTWLLSDARSATAVSGGSAVQLEVAAGEYHFQLL